jgi:hypothetical protein
MTPNINFDFGGGLFTMKDGSSTSASVTLALYQGTDDTGSLLTSFNLTQPDFCAQVSNCGQFAFHQFFFVAPVSLVAGTTYFAALTSAAANTQSLAYFIKNDSFFISDQSGTPIQPQPVDFGSPASSTIPEPHSLAFLGIGGGLLWGLNGAKSRKSYSIRRRTRLNVDLMV